ncbi:MAG: alpha/beta hydrolase [Deltaproteobacteria bacterium]|nr:alpha/beta hydrolase [Deltaproteobacteria bacterium]
MGSIVPIVPFRRGLFRELPDKPRLRHSYFSSGARNVEVDSAHFGRISVHLRVTGTGPPLLLVHGLMTSSYSWRYVLDLLGAHYTLYVPDLPGAGASDKPPVTYGPVETADFIGELMQTLGIVGCPVVGNSMGGYLCMLLALRDPSLMSRLVNIHSPGFPELRLHALRIALSVPGLGAGLAWFVRRSPLTWVHRNVHYRDESLKSLEEAKVYGVPLATRDGSQAFVSILRDTMAPGPMGAFQRQLKARVASGEDFPVPLLLLWARQDPMVPPSFGPRFQGRIPSAALQWVEAASHFAHVDQPEATAAAILAFLGEGSEPQSALHASGGEDSGDASP